MLSAYLPQCKETPELDHPVKVPEPYIARNENYIGWIPEEVAPEFDCLAEQKSPGDQKNEQRDTMVVQPED